MHSHQYYTLYNPVFFNEKMMKRIAYLTALTLFFFLCFISSPVLSAQSVKTASYPVRVAVIIDASEISLKINGNYSIYSLPLQKLLAEGKTLNNVKIEPTYSGILMGKEQFKIYGIKIKSDSAADIRINGRIFRGEMDIIRTKNLKLLVINHLDIEDYLKGVLYHEVSHWWPAEALKAQAIASRTFAIYKVIESRSKDYDLRSDVYSQVYGGKTSEKYRTNRAVDASAGKVLIYKNEILPAYFHATCGGHTEDAALLWSTSMKPLRGRPCRYCERSPHYHWSKKITLSDIETQLNRSGYKIKGIKAIKASARDRSGRVKTVNVIDSLGTEKIPSNKFRLAIGPATIRSTNFTIRMKKGTVIFKGKGWGHGVGMCQWGAYFMAKRRLKAVDILRFYYPGTKIVDLKNIVKQD